MKDSVHAAARFAEYLSTNRLKMTRERREILGRVLSLRGHFDADHLLALMRRSGCDVSRATLYRTLAVLVGAGLVDRLEMARGQARYEPMVGRHHHDHMVCLSCGSITEFESREIERLQEMVCRRKRFRMTGHTHQIQGYCAACTGPEGRGPGDAAKETHRPAIGAKGARPRGDAAKGPRPAGPSVKEVRRPAARAARRGVHVR